MFVILDRDETRGSAITILTGPTSVTGIRIEARRRCSNLLVDHLAEMVSAQDAPGQRFAAVYLADPVVNFHTGRQGARSLPIGHHVQHDLQRQGPFPPRLGQLVPRDDQHVLQQLAPVLRAAAVLDDLHVMWRCTASYELQVSLSVTVTVCVCFFFRNS